MRNIALVLILFTMLVGCNVSTPIEKPTHIAKPTGYEFGNNNYTTEVQIIEFDGCEYIGSFRGSNTDWGTHKGDCKNPIHKQNVVTIYDTVEYQLIKK